MKNSIFGLLIVSVLASNTMQAEENKTVAEKTPLVVEKETSFKPDSYSLSQLLTAFGAGSFAGYFKQKTKYVPRVFAIPGFILFGVATIAPNFTEHCSTNLVLGSYYRIRNQFMNMKETIKTKASNFKENSVRNSVTVPTSTTSTQSTSTQNN